jgi:molybdenum cofactor cytidylyltransferase
MSSLIQTAPRLAAIILAAGRASRMGRPKMLLEWGATTIVGHLVSEWGRVGAEQIAVVCAGNDSDIQATLREINFPGPCVIHNPAPERGMFSTILCAAQWPGWNPGITHWALALGDQPHLQFRTLRAMAEFSATHPDQVCQPAYGGRPRHPVFLPKKIFRELFASPAAHMKEFLSGREIGLCELDDSGLELDIDRPEDYERALRLWPKIEG